jgi:transposase
MIENGVVGSSSARAFWYAEWANRGSMNLHLVPGHVRKRLFLAVLKLNGARVQGRFVFAGLISSVKMYSVWARAMARFRRDSNSVSDSPFRRFSMASVCLPSKYQRRFGAMTQDLQELANWLRQFEVTQVAMESSGVYWKPVWNILEGQFTVLLANAQHIKNVPGRKTDQKDAEWIAQLLQRGLLRPSYVPCEVIRDLRDLTRMRASLSQESSRIRPHHRFLLRRLLDQLRFVEHEIVLLNERLEEIGREQPELSQAVARWDTIPGIDRVAGWTLLAEVGHTMAQFPTAEQLASWACLCPGNRESAGKRLGGKTRKGSRGCVA